jgi:hypothetical protein
MAQTTTAVQVLDGTGTPQSFVVEQDTVSHVLSPHHVIEVDGVPASAAHPMPMRRVGVPLIASTALEGSHIFSALPINLYEMTVSALTAEFAWLLVFDAIAVPADGAVTPLAALQSGGLTPVQITFGGAPAAFVHGVVGVLSSTGLFVKTSGPTGFLSAQVGS